MTQQELQKLLTNFESEVGHIKQWEIDKNERMRNQSSHAVKVGIKKGSYKNNGGINNQKLTPVLVWEYETNKFVGEYRSLRFCVNELDLDLKSTSEVIKGTYKQHKGYVIKRK